MNKINYQKELEKKIKDWQEAGEYPSLLLHCCCAPCASSCLEFLNPYMDITCFFFNPNITDRDEYIYRRDELERLIRELPAKREIRFLEGEYCPERYLAMSKGLENAPERGPRCVKCYDLRIEETARVASEQEFDCFATTLTLSPLKPAEIINTIGRQYPGYLETDFKKNNGYLRSIELSKQYGLYRQDYCGCGFSKAAKTAK